MRNPSSPPNFRAFSDRQGRKVYVGEYAVTPGCGQGNLRAAIGVGTWRTEAEFKDIMVIRGNETLFYCDFAQGTADWRLHGGEWSAQDHILRQKSHAENIRAFAGDKAWNALFYDAIKAKYPEMHLFANEWGRAGESQARNVG